MSGRCSEFIFSRCIGSRGWRSGSWCCCRWFLRSTTLSPSGRGSTARRKNAGGARSSSRGGVNAMSRPLPIPSENRSENLDGETGSGPLRGEFSREQRLILLGIAHGAIVAFLEQRALADAAGLPASLPPILREPRGVFSTLYLNGQLQGCVGYAAAVAPLYRAVAETARAAAFEASRFPPVTL